MFTLAQISDTHLGARTSLFRSNFDLVARTLSESPPDILVATGDVSLDGADVEADLALTAESFRRLPGQVLSVPGNHDVGDHPERAPRQPVNAERLARFRHHMGEDCWGVDREGWRLLGLNSQVMGSGLPEEAAQLRFIAEELETIGHRRLAVFLHKPFFLSDPADSVFDYWSVPPFTRGVLAPLLDHPALRLVASGHLHLHHRQRRGPATLVWAPSVGFIVAEDEQPGIPGGRPCGFLRHRFLKDSVETELVAPAGMEHPFIHDVRADAYPASPLLAAVEG
ncbi:metallophosphoesterase family protein [Roseicella aquatilis]|uniref:Metallophosphoesterase n=1 Tax=Roseicella aquatilis TaxID=2527868 RepID=A0A4V2WJD4_9PROT|nr:metallophosphoesterase [Roseicella aquatilis]TCZ51768.1 metallophosphoesterase [Roseicella aquatilis]